MKEAYHSLPKDCDIDFLGLRLKSIYLSHCFIYRIVLSRRLCTKPNPYTNTHLDHVIYYLIVVLFIFDEYRQEPHLLRCFLPMATRNEPSEPTYQASRP